MEPNSQMPQTPPQESGAHKPDALDEVRVQMKSQEDDDRRAHIEYLRSITGPRKPKRPWAKILTIIVIALLAAGAVYWFVLRKPTGASKETENTNSAQTQKAPEETEEALTKHHESSNFMLGFDYPENWTVKDDGTGKLTISSPAIQLKVADGKKTQGQIAITIQGKQSALDAFKSGNAVAARESEKLAYAKPTQNQRAETYVSFLTYAGATASGIDALYITGDLGYQKSQAIPQVDVVRSDPLISVMFWKCKGSNCTEGPGLSLDAASWNAAAAPAKTIRAIIASLSIQ